MAKTQTTENLTPADRAADKLRAQVEHVVSDLIAEAGWTV